MRHIQQAGGIVMNHKGQIAIITSQTHRQTFPKGSIEAGESAIDAAQREIYEETGLQQIRLESELGVLIRPGFTHTNLDTPSVMKYITMFFFTVNDEQLQPIEADVLAAQWINREDVATILSWPEEADFFQANRAKLKL